MPGPSNLQPQPPRRKSRSGGDEVWSFVRMLIVIGLLAGLIYFGWTTPLRDYAVTSFNLAPPPPKPPIVAQIATRPVKKLTVPKNISIPGLGPPRATIPQSMPAAKRSDGSP